jgi:HpcH/HpaI aldolase/citrate lyase family
VSTSVGNPLAGPGSAGKPNGVQLGIGLTCPSPELAQICAHAGFDVVLIDMEHGPISIETAYRMVTAISGSPAEAWVRVAHNDATLIKLALDIGVREIIVPMVTTAAEAERAVSAAKYPPAGIRGWGPFRTQYQWRTRMLDYAGRANTETRLSVLIEHPQAIENLDDILPSTISAVRFSPPSTSPSTWVSWMDPVTLRSRKPSPAHGRRSPAKDSGSLASPLPRSRDKLRSPVASSCSSSASTRCSCLER